MRRKRVRALVRVTLISLGAYLGISAFLARMFVAPSRSVASPIPTLAEETLAGTACFVTKDWQAHSTVYLLIHGYGGNRATYAPLVPKLQASGAAVIIPSMPGHDASPVAEVGFGTKESALIRELARLARSRRVIAVGISLGGAAVWQAAGEEPDLFDAVATEGTYPDFQRATERFLGRSGMGSAFFEPIVEAGKRMSGIDPTSLRPIEGARAWRATGKPAALCHGEDDAMFPVSFGEELAEAAGVPLWRVPEARHAGVQDADLDGWARRLIDLAREAPDSPASKR